MAEVTPQRPAAKTASKPAPAPRKGKPSGMPVLLLTLVMGAIVHLLLCMLTQSAADELTWTIYAVDGSVRFGEAQFFLNAVVSYLPFDLFFGFGLAVIIGFTVRLPFFKQRVIHTIADVKKRLMLQLSASKEEVESIIRNDPDNNTRLLSRRDDINIESVQHELEAINGAQRYLDGKGSPMQGLSMYMKFHFVENYANTVQGLAYAGAAFLIIVIGIRGLKFIPAVKPSPILFALGIEFSLLSLLSLSLLYTEEEERTDRILKQMVDAVKGGKGQKAVAQLVEEEQQLQLSRADYERIVREQMDKKILELMSDKEDDALRRIALDLVAKG